jgi:glycine hydroxymethyltransferase
LESLSQQRAQKLFNASRAWVQPLSGSLANLIVLTSLFGRRLQAREDVKIFAMGLDQGGHLSHGAKAHISGMLFRNIKAYNVGRNSGFLHYDSIEAEALEYKPDLIICGASAYPREIDFARMGTIAKKCGSILLSDIAHIFGLVAAGVHPSPIPHSHFVTASTYKAGGPKGGIILAGDKATDEQRKSVDRAIFPGVQSTPDFASIAAKAVFFKECMGDDYRATQKRIISNAAALAESLIAKGFYVVTGGTDNHIVLVNVKSSVGLTGKDADLRLERCGLNVNKNILPFDTENPQVGSGIRIGTNTVSRLGMGANEMKTIASMIDDVLRGDMSDAFVNEMRRRVKKLASAFPHDCF